MRSTEDIDRAETFALDRPMASGSARYSGARCGRMWGAVGTRCFSATLLAVLLLSTTFFLPGTARAQSGEFPWDRVVGIDSPMVDPAGRARVEALAASTPNYHGCRGTVAECIAQDPPDTTARRLAGFLARRVMAGDSDAEIAALLRERYRSVHPRMLAEIDLAEAPCFGADADSALVTVVEFADFECPYCRMAAPILHDIIEERADRVRLCFKNFPIRSHPRGLPSCVAGLAAHRQGRFWAMHDALYAVAPDLSDEALERAARTAELDLDAFREAMTSEALVEEVMADKYEGLEIGVDRTPTLFVNGKHYIGLLSEAELADRIDEELDLVNAGEP
jgi:predicted DsbA family dithiol-disulfide isomerase